MPSCVPHQPHAATSPLMSFARRLSASRPRCELGSGQAPYPGRWTAQREPPPYELNASVWMQMGLNEIRDAKPPGHKHDWGRCAKPRVLYDWSPEQCSLLPFERDDVCSGCVLGRQVLFVGDSTTSQLFTSFVLLLGGTFGKNRVRGSTTVMLTASVCNDSVRLSYVRSDLLLWTHDMTVPQAVARCDPILFNYRWAMQAVLDADVVVIGIGQHFTQSLFLARQEMQHRVYSFFTGSINRTLFSLAVGDDCYYVVSVGANKFLDTHGSAVWTWGDGKDVGEFPAQITWRLVPVAATSSLCYLINVASHRYLEAHRAGARVSIGSGRRQNLQWEIRRA
jgi:hypothetical protein